MVSNAPAPTNLLYIGDVPVEASYHGSALLYRLLSEYPHEKLTIIETAGCSQPERRLPNVNYISQPIARQRWLNTRFHRQAISWFTRAADRSAPRISHSFNGFKAEGVLTVAHGFGWLAAARIANDGNVPLHLMVHDDWPRVANVTARFRQRLDEQFAHVYRQARSRLCVSPAMSRAYQKRYGKPADVIYPGRAPASPDFAEPPPRLRRSDKPFTVAFAGTINSNGYIRALRELQEALKLVGGRLLIFGPITAVEAKRVGLNSTTRVNGLLSSSELMTRVREEADALFVPMSFDSRDCVNMQMAFPSKLADCTAAGLPLLIYGPHYCSAVAWARENSGVAEVVENEDTLSQAVHRLANDAEHRIALATRALEVGRAYFSHDRVQQIFIRALSV
ncbi:MAG TPA: glycosyltransferase [Pyrinomonadaceae bacterium]|nr:glycosyltransferase [Pyrinomonadaceae bacterium]